MTEVNYAPVNNLRTLTAVPVCYNTVRYITIKRQENF